MSKRRISIWLALPVVAAGALLAFIVGLFSYMSLTATPLHPDPTTVPSTARSQRVPRWSPAIDRAREIVRTNISKQNLPGVSIAVGADG
jgi:hypothetical protein